MQGASIDLEEAFQDKDDAFECVTALLDDTLEQADAAVETAKKALKQGDIAATSQVSHQYNYCLTHTTLSNRNMVCEKQHTVCYAVHDGLQHLMSEIQYHQLHLITNTIIITTENLLAVCIPYNLRHLPATSTSQQCMFCFVCDSAVSGSLSFCWEHSLQAIHCWKLDRQHSESFLIYIIYAVG